MCGVTAVIAPRLPQEELGRLVADVTARLTHRGPDNSACSARGAVALGHTRLRVVDPRAAADQPMSFEDKHLVFSGAIMNHRELRRELAEEHRVVFATTSDTEVLLHMLRIFGDRALDRLKGMFAFVFHDARSDRVLAARDRMGIKPLVWTRLANGTLVIASEAQALVRSAGIDRSIDRVAIRQIARFNHPLGDHTFFDRIRAVEPGCSMSIDAATAEHEIRRWSSVRLRPERIELCAAVDRLDVAFRSAVNRCVDVDVPVGCYLSGGVDSSGIVAELVNERRAPRLYSLVFPNVRYSEETAIDAVTDLLRVRTEKVPIEGLSLDDFVAYAIRAEMPQWWTSDLALGALARRARSDGTTVVLTGEGPDELFAGYEIYRVARVRALLMRAAGLVGAGAAAQSIAKRFVPWLDVDMSVAQAYLASHSPRRNAAIVDHFGFHPENLALWEILDSRGALAAPLATEDQRYRESERAYFHDALGPSFEGLTNLERNLQFEVGERLPRWILHMGDRMSTTHGLELRFPYLDDDFVDVSTRLPMRLRSTVLEDKRVLCRMHRRRLPSSIATRRKQPLYTPTAEWLGPVLSDPALECYWSRRTFDRVGMMDFDVCDRARARLAVKEKSDALTAMVDEWLFTFALTTSIIAVDLCGA